jgi:GR25 family glycosyltransferase involved in LPS biosynthesis
MNFIIYFLLSIVIILFVYYIYVVLKSKTEYLDTKIKVKNKLNFLKKNLNLKKFSNYIDKHILYINLDNCIDRNESIKTQLNNFGLKYTRIPAIDGKKINFKKDNTYYFSYINNFKNGSKYELACTLSHIKAIKHAYENNLGTVIIMEDDIDLSLIPLWKYKINEIINMSPKDWRIIQLYNNECKIQNEISFINNKYCYGTVSYIINTEGQKKIMNLFKNNILYLNPKDSKDEIGADKFIYSNVKNFYTLSKPIFSLSNEDKNLNSTIHPNHNFKHHKRSFEIIKHYLK